MRRLPIYCRCVLSSPQSSARSSTPYGPGRRSPMALWLACLIHVNADNYLAAMVTFTLTD